MGRPWEIQPGRGERILAGLGEDVQLRAKFPSTSWLQNEVTLGEDAAESIITRGMKALAADNVGFGSGLILGRLMAAEKRSLAATHIGNGLLDKIEQLERKSYLEANPDEWRAHLGVLITPLVPDAVFWHVTSGWPRTRERETRMLHVGEERGGRFTMHDSFISAPDVGGQLTIMAGWNMLEGNGVTVTGLVSPETGEPQVDLEVLARAG